LNNTLQNTKSQKILFSDKNNECFGVNILPQITGNCVSELPDFKNFLGGMPPYPPRGEGAFGPFHQLQWMLTKGRHLLQMLLKALVF